MSRRSTWITGARGFIGRHVARECAARGGLVAGLGHGAWSNPEAAPWGISHWLNGDITASNLSRLAETTGLPGVVLHLAGGSSVGSAIDQPREDFFRTVATTVELLEWLRLASPATVVVAVSSAAVYGAGHEGLITEDARLTPFSPYGHHKLMMESLCRSYGDTYGLRAVVARLFSVYGDGLTKQLLWDACAQLEAGVGSLSLGGTGRELRDWVHVDDIAAVLATLDAQAATTVPVFNVASGRGTPVSGIADALVSAWRKARGGPAIGVTFTGRSRPGDPFSLVADVGALAGIGARCEHEVATGIAAYVAWFERYRASLA